MLYGRKGHPAFITLEKYLYAHRGYHHKPQIPENSLPAFRMAAERGWGAELDVHLLRDGTLAVFHDSDLMRCTGACGFIEDLDREELDTLRLEGTSEHVPLFDEVLEIFENRTPLIIELKTFRGNHRALAEAVCRRLDTYKGCFCIESFDPFAIMDVKMLRPEICRGQLASDFLKDRQGMKLWKCFLAANLAFDPLAQPDFISYRFEDRDNPVLRRSVRKGVKEFSWTIRSRGDLAVCDAENCIAIFECFDPEEQ